MCGRLRGGGRDCEGDCKCWDVGGTDSASEHTGSWALSCMDNLDGLSLWAGAACKPKRFVAEFCMEIEGCGWLDDWHVGAAREPRSSGAASCTDVLEDFKRRDDWSAGAAREPGSSGAASCI